MIRHSLFAAVLLSTTIARAAPPKGDAALAAISTAEPFTVPADVLRQAAPDAAPNAHAEVLWRSVHYSYDSEHRQTVKHHWVVRVLDAEGIEQWGTLRFAWAPWHETRPTVRARVITADGRALELDPKTTTEATPGGDALLVHDNKELVAPLPGVGRGATIEVTSEVHDHQKVYPTPGASGRWYVAFEEPTRRARLLITTPSEISVSLRQHGMQVADTTAKGQRRLELTATPTLITEGVDFDSVPRVSWSTGGSWQAMARAYLAIVERVRADKAPSGALVAPSGKDVTRRHKIDKLLSDMRARVRYTGLELGESAVVPYTPAEVWRREYGDCKDMAVLLVAALADAGIPANVALLDAGVGRDIEAELPGLDLFDHAIVYVPAAGTEPALWIDPTATGFGAGVLPMGDIERQALVIDAATTAPILTTRRAESRFVHRGELHARLDLFGTSSATKRSTYTDTGAAFMRASLDGLDRKELMARYEPWQKAQLDGELTDVQVAVRADGAVEVMTTVKNASALGAGWSEWTVPLPGYDILGYLPDSESKSPPRALRLPMVYDLATTMTIEAPNGFVVAAGVGEETVKLGPATWKQTIAKVPGKENVVSATFTLDLARVDWSAAEVAEFRAAYARFSELPKHEVVFRHGASAFIDSGAVEAGLARFREQLAKDPKDTITRARMAIALNDLGLGEVARAEVDRAAKDAPTDRVVLWAASIVHSADMLGRLYVPGWDRSGAIAYLRKLHKLFPDWPEARLKLAQALVLDARGVNLTSGADLDEGLALLRRVALEDEQEESYAPFAALLWQLDKIDELARVGAELGPDQRAFWLAAVARAQGVDATLKAAATLPASDQPTALQSAYGLVVAQRDYPTALALLDAALLRFPALRGLQAARPVLADLKPRPKDVARTTPEGALLALIDGLVTDTAPGGMVRALQRATAPAHWRADGAALGAAQVLRRSGIDTSSAVLDFSYDIIWHHGQRVVDAAGTSGWRLRVATDVGTRSFAFDSYWLPGTPAALLVAFGADYAELGERARQLALAGDLSAAKQWLDWAREAIASLSDKVDLAGVWPPQGEATRETILAAAAWFAVQGRKPHADALALAVSRLGSWPAAARTDALRGLGRYAEPNALLVALDALPERDNTTELLRCALLARAQRLADAKALAEARLAADPASRQWPLMLSTLAMAEGDVAGAAARLQPLVAAGYDEASNNYAWYQLFIERASEDTERIAQRAVDHATKRSGSDLAAHASLNTLTMIQLERGRWSEGVATLKRTISDASDVSPEDWLLVGRLAEGLGYRELALKSYAKVPKRGEDATSSWHLAQRRLAKLRR